MRKRPNVTRKDSDHFQGTSVIQLVCLAKWRGSRVLQSRPQFTSLAATKVQNSVIYCIYFTFSSLHSPFSGSLSFHCSVVFVWLLNESFLRSHFGNLLLRFAPNEGDWVYLWKKVILTSMYFLFKFYLIVMIAWKPKPAKYHIKLHEIHILVGRMGQPKGKKSQ